MSTEHKKNHASGYNYLGLSFQMGILIFLGAYGGMKLDEKTGTKYLFSILFSLFAIALSMYYIIHKETSKNKKKKK